MYYECTSHTTLHSGLHPEHMYTEKVHADIRTYVCMYIHVCVQMLSDANLQDGCYTSHAEVIWVRTPLALASVRPLRSHSALPPHSPPSPGGGTDAVPHLIHQDRCSPARATTVLHGNNLVFSVQHLFNPCASSIPACKHSLTAIHLIIWEMDTQADSAYCGVKTAKAWELVHLQSDIQTCSIHLTSNH